MTDDYPLQKVLEEITNFNVIENDVMILVKLICDIWHWEDYAVLKGKKLELHTGGWSGNESIITALMRNKTFWNMCWQKSVTGGHYFFKIPKIEKEEK